MGKGNPPTATVYTGGEKLIERVVSENSFPNIKECARFLHKMEPRRSVDGWRSKIYRFQGETGRDLVKEWASKSFEDVTSSYTSV